MRTGATQDFTHNPYVKIVVGGDTYTTADATPRIISATTDEQIYGGRYTITFYNGDDFFNTVPAKAYEGLPLDLYFGFSTTPVTGSYLGTLIVEKQSFSNKRKTFILTCFDSIGKLSLHQGSVGGSVWNHPSQTLTALGEVVLPSGEPLPAALITAINAQYDKTAWQIIQTVVAATTGVTVNLVNDDTYIQVQKPLVNAGDARSVIIQALGATESYLRIKTNTANLDVIQPSALTGGNPAYTYNDSNYYWNDTDEKAVVVPNTIIYYGITVARALINTGATHGINQASIDLLGNIYEHNDYDPISRENSVTQAEVDAKADRRIAKLVLALGTGTVVAPMNCAQELFDKIIVTDTRYTPTKTITGYVSRIQREFGQGVYRITIELGGVETGYTPARGVEAKMMPSAPGVPPIDSTFLIPKAIQGYYHDIHFVADDYDTVSWLAGTIKFYDGTTQAVSAGNTGNLANTTLRYIYFDLNDVAPGTLKVTTDYLSVMTTKTGILCLIQKGSISGIKATVIPSYGKEPLITPDFIDM